MKFIKIFETINWLKIFVIFFLMATASQVLQIITLQKNPETERHGLKWMKEEDDELLEEVNNKKSIDDIAKNHKRTPSSIKLRIMQHTVNLITSDEISIEEACIKMNIDINEFKKFKKKQESKKSENTQTNMQNKTITKDDKYMKILEEIRDLLVVISKK